MASEWTDDDDLAAKSEGWAVFNFGCSYTARIERLDDAQECGGDFPQLADDSDAWRLVYSGMKAGSDLHTRAFAAVTDNERAAIIDFMEGQ